MGERLAAAGSTEGELDAQALLKAMMPEAKAGLEAEGGFKPLAAVVRQDGSVQRVGPVKGSGEERPTGEVVAVLREALRSEVSAGGARTTALAADVRIWRRQDGDEASNAVSVHVEHQDGYCVDLLIPYKVRKGMISRLRKKPQVIFRTMIAQESNPVTFNQAAMTGTSGQTERTAW